MMTAIKSFFAALATMPSQQEKQSSEHEALDVRINKLRIEPGDALVITIEKHLTKLQREQIKAIVIGAMPDTKALVLDGGLQLSVLARKG